MFAAVFVQSQPITPIWVYVWLAVVATLFVLGGYGIVQTIRAMRRPEPVPVQLRMFCAAGLAALVAFAFAEAQPLYAVVIEGIACCDYYWWLLFFCWPESWGC